MIQEELKKILEKGVVVKCEHEAVESIHPFFLGKRQMEPKNSSITWKVQMGICNQWRSQGIFGADRFIHRTEKDATMLATERESFQSLCLQKL